MIFRITSILFGLTFLNYVTKGNITSGDVPAKVLLTSYYVSRKTLNKDLTSCSVTSILHHLRLLQWNRMVIFYDDLHWDDAQLISREVTLSSMHSIHPLSGVEELLMQFHQDFYPKLHFLLLSSYTTAMELLELVDGFDVNSNRTTDFRHHSFWLVICKDKYHQTMNIQPHVLQLEHVTMYYTNEGAGHSIVLQPLGSAPVQRRDYSAGDMGEIKSQDVFPNTKYGLNNRRLIVSTLEDQPFIMKAEHGFEGYLIDILNSLATALNFSYDIVYPPDMKWGQIVNGKWNGLIGQLQRREVDLVVASMTIHEDREKVMDFLYPPIFTKVDDIVYKLQPYGGDSWQAYLKPFSNVVFMFLLVSLLISNLIASSISRYNDKHTDERGNPYSWAQVWIRHWNMLLYMYGILLGRGIEFNAGSQSLRMFLFTWGLFSVVIAAFYSANLVSIFTIQKPKLPFTSLDELVNQKDYKWGFISGSIREHIFKSSKSGAMKMAWEGVLQFNNTDPSVLSDKQAVHVSKLKTEKYAFISTRYRIKNFRNDDCDIRHVGQDVIWHQYGIGVPTNYPLRKELEEKINMIADSGLLDIWWRRWTNSKPDRCTGSHPASTLTLQDVSAPFYILCGGIVVAAIALLTEILVHKLHH